MSRAFNNNAANYLSGDFGAGATKTVPLTVFAWVKIADVGASIDTISALGTSQASVNDSVRSLATSTLDQLSATAVSLADGSAAGTLTLGTANEGDGIWMPVMATFTSATNRKLRAMYPRENGSQNSGSVTTTGLRYLFVGVNNAVGAPMNGNIAELAWWNSALGDSDFDLLVTGAQTGATPKSAIPTNLIAYYSLNSDTGATIPDESGNGGPTLTVTGTVSYAAAHPTISDVSPIRMVWRM